MRTRFQYFGLQNIETTCDNISGKCKHNDCYYSWDLYIQVYDCQFLAPICYAVDILKTFFSCSDVKWWNFNVKVDAPCFSLSLIHFK